MPMAGLQRKAALVERGISFASIASATGMSDAYVGNVVLGRRRNDRVEAAVCQAIKRPHEEVFEPLPPSWRSQPWAGKKPAKPKGRKRARARAA